MSRSHSLKIILREEQFVDDYRYLGVELNKDGDLVFEGQDLGKSVKEYYGSIEYEWIWTIKAKDILLFENAMGKHGNLLRNIEQEFSGEKAKDLYEFLQKNKIPFESWHRIGD